MRNFLRFRPSHLTAALFFSALFASIGYAQESSSSTSSISPDSSPSSALRDVLAAACSQNQKEFARFLTARNAQTFARLNAMARVALMKRFVLLDEPGKSSVASNPSGRPTVICETPALTAEMHIGGASTQQNLAWVPLEIRATSDTSGAGVRRVQIGFVREAEGWKILSVGLLLLDLPSLEVEWDRASLEANEKEAIETLKSVAKALETYRRTYLHLPEGLAKLGPPAHGAASAAAAALLDSELAAGVKSGYSFRFVIAGGSAMGAPAKYELAATPLIYGASGKRSFFRDAEGVIHAADRQGALAGSADSRIE